MPSQQYDPHEDIKDAELPDTRAVQVEGRSLGRRCAFVRLGGCNLSCHWCDTPYIWVWKGTSSAGVKYEPRNELHRRAVGSVAEEVLAFGVALVVISGGEPLGQQTRLVPLIEILTGHGIEVEIETNGAHAPTPALVATGARLNVSPKLSHSGDPEERRIVPAVLTRLAQTPDSTFKFVCRGKEDLDEVADLVARFGLRSVWIMPEGQTVEEIGTHVKDLARR